LTQLSRIGDQLPRARHRLSSGTASLLIAEPARREPTATELARAAEQELYVERDRSGRARVSIHVEVTHPELDTRFDVVEAQVIEAKAVPVERYEPEAKPLPMFALAAPEESSPSAGFDVSPHLTSEAFVGYAAERAIGAYAAQRAFVGAQPASATRLLDVRA
jgi:hypothetical protein